MKKLSKMYNTKFLNIFLLFQPIIDILTSFMMRYLDIPITLGIVCRTLFLLYAIVYLIFISKEHRKFKLIYFSLFILYFILFFVINCTNAYCISELINFVKFIYYPTILLFLVEIIDKEITINYIYKSVIIVNILMLLAQLFGNTISSYGYQKIGNSGWFFSANELSVILSMLFPIAFYKFLNKNNKINIFILILTVISMLIIGTKTTYLAIVITVISYLIYLLFWKWIYKIKIGQKIKKIIIFFALFLLITPFTPIYNNMNLHLKFLNVSGVVNEGNEDNESVINLVLYGRERYLSFIKEISENSNLKTKLIGLGKVVKDKNSEFDYYEVEMDFYNIIYSYGIVGMILFFLPQIIIFYKIIKKIISSKFKIINDKIIVLFISILISYLVAFLAGHTLLAISPATYLAYLVALLYFYVMKLKEVEEKKVMFISSVGGHLTQLLEFKTLFDKYDYILITEKTDVTKDLKNKYYISYLPYGSRNQKYTYPFILAWNCIKSLAYLIYYDPDVIITTGANTAAATCCLGKLFGKKIIFIESFAKRTSPTITGKMIYKLHAYTVFVVQWESMLEHYPNAVYWGGIY